MSKIEGGDRLKSVAGAATLLRESFVVEILGPQLRQLEAGTLPADQKFKVLGGLAALGAGITGRSKEEVQKILEQLQGVTI